MPGAKYGRKLKEGEECKVAVELRSDDTLGREMAEVKPTKLSFYKINSSVTQEADTMPTEFEDDYQR